MCVFTFLVVFAVVHFSRKYLQARTALKKQREQVQREKAAEGAQ